MRNTLKFAAVSVSIILGAIGATSLANAQSAETLRTVIDRGTVRIAVIGGYAPYSIITPEGKPEGYDIDIGKAFAASLGVEPDFVVTDVPGRITALQTGKADLTIAALTATVQRSTAVAFSDPYLVISMQFVTLADKTELSDLAAIDKAGVTIGVPRGTTQDAAVPLIAPNAQVLQFANVSDSLLALDTGQADVMAQDSIYVTALMEKHPGKYRKLEGNYSREELAIGMPTGDFDWWRVVNVFVNDFNKSGTNGTSFRKWFGSDIPSME